MADNANSFGSTKKGMTHLDSPYVIHSLAPLNPMVMSIQETSCMETRMRCVQPYHGTEEILKTSCLYVTLSRSATFLTLRKVFNLAG